MRVDGEDDGTRTKNKRIRRKTLRRCRREMMIFHIYDNTNSCRIGRDGIYFETRCRWPCDFFSFFLLRVCNRIRDRSSRCKLCPWSVCRGYERDFEILRGTSPRAGFKTDVRRKKKHLSFSGESKRDKQDSRRPKIADNLAKKQSRPCATVGRPKPEKPVPVLVFNTVSVSFFCKQ